MNRKEQLDAAREFARRIIQASWDGSSVDGGEVQEWAQELGLIFSRKATKADAQDYPELEEGYDMFEFEKWMQTPSPPDGLPYR
jgi:hypothetical protein